MSSGEVPAKLARNYNLLLNIAQLQRKQLGVTEIGPKIVELEKHILELIKEVNPSAVYPPPPSSPPPQTSEVSSDDNSDEGHTDERTKRARLDG
mmetsp:Transcript_75438/g.177110  ORF Transcript_75438/g.177110 Transcript_75438/m.177110 type:complete len:94 (+) Transcript_75438:7-288(+)